MLIISFYGQKRKEICGQYNVNSNSFALIGFFLSFLLPVALVLISYQSRIDYYFIFRHHSNFVNCVRYSPDGSKFLSVSSDKKGIIYDGKSGDKIGELSSEGAHTGSIYAASWSPDGKQVS